MSERRVRALARARGFESLPAYHTDSPRKHSGTRRLLFVGVSPSRRTIQIKYLEILLGEPQVHGTEAHRVGDAPHSDFLFEIRGLKSRTS